MEPARADLVMHVRARAVGQMVLPRVPRAELIDRRAANVVDRLAVAEDAAFRTVVAELVVTHDGPPTTGGC